MEKQRFQRSTLLMENLKKMGQFTNMNLKTKIKILMRNGLPSLANYLSREHKNMSEMEEAWEEWDAEKQWQDNQEELWKLSIPSAKVRVQGFIDGGSITEEWAENAHRRFLQMRFEELIREFYETSADEVPKELKKIFSEYNFRYEGG